MIGPVYRDRVRDTTTSTGTGTITLQNNPPTGYRSFSAVPDGALVEFVIDDGSSWEVARGVYSAAGPSLTRDTLLASSTGTAIAFSGGSKDVVHVAPAAALGGGLVHILTQEVTAQVANVTFEDGIGGVDFNDRFDAYRIFLSNIKAVTTGQLQCQLMQGGSPVNSASAYKYRGNRSNASSSDFAGAMFSGTGANAIRLCDGIGSGTGAVAAMEVTVWSPAEADSRKVISWHGANVPATGSLNRATGAAALFDNTSAIDGIRFFCDTGNLSAGKFALFGVRTPA